MNNKKTLLIVDDMPENIDILDGILNKLYKIKAAPNGKIALKVALSQKPDLILLDMMMPDMNGLQVLQKLKESDKTSSIPVIFVTANDSPGEIEKAKLKGAADFILKPVDPEVVKTTIEKYT